MTAEVLMDSSERSRRERVILAFIERYRSDEDAGQVRPLDAYLDQFPDHEEAIAREYLALVAAPEGESCQRPPSEGLGPYRLVRELGRGGQGVVYLAEDTRLGRHVALKMLVGLGAGADAVVQRFRREAEVASRLNHPGICSVLDAGVAEGVPYIAMRYVEGESLSHHIGAGTRSDSTEDVSFLDLSDAEPPTEWDGTRSGDVTMSREQLQRILGLVEKVARALHAAHSAGVLHRDVKPANIMVGKDGDPVILDFGLARSNDDDQVSLTDTGDVFGTPAYMSPEQVAGVCHRLDARSDVYSLGVTLYECLTLRRPFDAATREGTYRAILTQEAPDPRCLNRAIPKDLTVVLETALAKERDRRYQSAAAFADDLRAVAEMRPVRARPVGVFGRAARWARRHPARATALVGLMVALPIVAGMAGYIRANADDVEAERRARTQALVEVHLEAGFFELRSGERERAAREFRAALALDDGSPEAAAGLASFYLREERHTDALQTLREASQRLRDPSLFASMEANALAALGREEEAASARARVRRPDSSLGWFLEGIRLVDEGVAAERELFWDQTLDRETPASRVAFTAAVHHLLQAVRTSPEARRAYHFELGRALTRAGDDEIAHRIADAIVALWPDAQMAWINVGMILERRDPDAALAAYDRAFGLAPVTEFLLERCGNLLSMLGRHKEALALRERYADAGFSPVYWFNTGRAASQADDLEGAEAAYRRALDAGHELQWAVQLNLAFVYQRQGRSEEEEQCLRAALAAQPEDGLVQSGWGA